MLCPRIELAAEKIERLDTDAGDCPQNVARNGVLGDGRVSTSQTPVSAVVRELS